MSAPTDPGGSGTSIFARALVKEARRTGTTDRYIAEACGVPEGVVGTWQSGSAVPTGRALARLRGVFPRLRGLQTVEERGTEILDRDDKRYRVEDAEQEAKRREQEVAAEKKRLESRPPTKWGDALRHHRVKQGLDRASLAEILEVTPPTIDKWEGGTNLPSTQNLDRIHAVLMELRADVEAGRVERPKSRSRDTSRSRAGTPRADARHQRPRLIELSEDSLAGARYAQALRDLHAAKIALADLKARVASAEGSVQERSAAVDAALEAVFELTRRSAEGAR